MNFTFRKAKIEDLENIWAIIEKAIDRRKADGSNQWQDGYPNAEVLKKDISLKIGHVPCTDNDIVAYTTVGINAEPEYNNLKGKWLTNTDYVVFHRLAVAENYLGKGVATTCFNLIHAFAKKNNINSIKADTNFDNEPMLHLFKKFDYKYCGKVYFRGSERLAFEKLLH